MRDSKPIYATLVYGIIYGMCFILSYSAYPVLALLTHLALYVMPVCLVVLAAQYYAYHFIGMFYRKFWKGLNHDNV